MIGVVLLFVSVRVYLFPTAKTVYPIFSSSARLWWSGGDLYDVKRPGLVQGGFRYSPVIAVFFSPFALLPDFVGGVLWRIAGVGIFFFSLVWLTRTVLPVALSRNSCGLARDPVFAHVPAKREQWAGEPHRDRFDARRRRRRAGKTLESRQHASGPGGCLQGLSPGSGAGAHAFVSATGWGRAFHSPWRPVCCCRSCARSHIMSRTSTKNGFICSVRTIARRYQCATCIAIFGY